jgi:hypothetical protein
LNCHHLVIQIYFNNHHLVASPALNPHCLVIGLGIDWAMIIDWAMDLSLVGHWLGSLGVSLRARQQNDY